MSAIPDDDDGRLETVAKIAAAGLALAYALGLIISNVFLDSFGATDFAVLRPRLVLVGLAFLIYIAIPLTVVGVPLLLLHHVRLAPRKRWLLAALLVVALFVLIPAPFEIFIWSVKRTSRLWFWWRFWREVYGGSYEQWIFIPSLLLLPACVLLYARLARIALNVLIRAVLVLALVVGVVSQIIPYSGFVYPAIEPSAGGGHPELVEIVFRGEMQTQTFGRVPNGHYLLWHATSETIVLTGASEGPIVRTYIVRADQVLAMLVRDAHVRLRRGAIEYVITHGPECDMRQRFASLPP